MQRTWFWKKFEMSCQVLENITIRSCNSSKSRRASNLKLREVDSTRGSAFESNNKDLRRRTKLLEPRLNDVTTIESTGAMLCETFAISSCDTLSIQNVDTNEMRKRPANKRPDFAAATKREEFARYENATCDTSVNSSCNILDISDIDANSETGRDTTNSGSKFLVSRNENVSSCNSGILNTAFIDLDEMEEAYLSDKSSGFSFDEDEEFARREGTMMMSDDSFLIIKSDVDTGVNVYVDFDDDTGIDTLNILDLEEEENVARIEFSSDFVRNNIPCCSSSPIISSQRSPIFTSCIISNKGWILNDNFAGLVSSSLVQDKNKIDHDDVVIRLNDGICKQQDKVYNEQKYQQPKCTKKRHNKRFWKLQKHFRRMRRLNNSVSKAVNLSGYEADDEDVVSTKKNEILIQISRAKGVRGS